MVFSLSIGYLIIISNYSNSVRVWQNRIQGSITKTNGRSYVNFSIFIIQLSAWIANKRIYFEYEKPCMNMKSSSRGRTDLAIHFQPSWRTTSECFSYPYAVPKFIQLRHRPRESVKNARSSLNEFGYSIFCELPLFFIIVFDMLVMPLFFI